MRYGCPNTNCNINTKKDSIVKNGTYYRKSDSRQITRYKCTFCGKRFSNASFAMEVNQNKRRVNIKVLELISSGVSIRRCAKLLKIHPITVARKIKFLGLKTEIIHSHFLKSLEAKKVKKVQFDDLITTEHTKLKPLSVSIAVDETSRKILGAEVSVIPAFGHLAKLSVKKYGYRKSTHVDGLKRLFYKIQRSIHVEAKFTSDEHRIYPEFVKSYFPMAKHITHKGGRGSVAGQGELKKLNYDPLFAINHTCAMLRANVNRLIRKTWCTTKDPEMLKAHLNIYIHYHNKFLL